jgi:hypothetical protein
MSKETLIDPALEPYFKEEFAFHYLYDKLDAIQIAELLDFGVEGTMCEKLKPQHV